LEQIQDRRTDPRSDIYALGATLYHLLTGVKPPDALVRATALVNGEPDPLIPADQIHPAVGSRIAAILSKAMAQKSEDRFASASDFREALRRMGRSEPVGALEPSAEELDVMSKAPEQHRQSIQLPMVASARRFGPAGVTLLVIVLAAIAAVAFYEFEISKMDVRRSSSSLVTSASLSARSNTVTRKAEKPREQIETQNSTPVVTVLRDSTRTEKIANKAETKTVANKPETKTQVKRVESAPVPSSNAPRERHSRPNAPSIKFPSPEVADAYRLTSFDSGLRRFQPAGGSPQFFRAPDGTYTVKFSDGSTRIIKAGERTAQ